MKISTICRGSGKIFIKAIFDKPWKSLSLGISCGNDLSFPGLILPFNGSDTECVAVAPQMLLDQKLTFTSFDATGNIIEVHEETLSANTTKWKSRFNYKLHGADCQAIRDYDVNQFETRLIMPLLEVIPDGDFLILRFLVRMPWRDDTSLKVSVFDDGAAPIPTKMITLGDRKVFDKYSKTECHREMQVSFRVPNRPCGYLFVLQDKNNPEFKSFEFLEAEIRDANMEEFYSTPRINAQGDPDYDELFQKTRAKATDIAEQQRATFEQTPTFSIVVPLFKTPLDLYDQMSASVLAQSYPHWELILVNASPEDAQLAARVEATAASDARVKVITLEENLGISGNTNLGIKQATGDFICFFDHDDLLEPDALFEYALAVNKYDDIDLMYCDEDKLDEKGIYTQPYFKPDFSIDLLRSGNYIVHLLCIRTSLLKQLEPSAKRHDGAQDHDLTLKAAEKARRVHHVAKVLYHWRMSATSTAGNASDKSYATDAGIVAVQEHLDRLGINATVSAGDRPFTYRVKYAVPESHPKVSIIIPSKDYTNVLDTCIQSIVEKSTYDNYEIIVIENNSTESETFTYYEKIQQDHPCVRVEYWPAEFNFSKLMNFGAQKATGEYLLLLNNDTEVITPDWIEEMLGICARPEVGAVGARLYYPDDVVQHAGVLLSGKCAGHVDVGIARHTLGYFALSSTTRNVSAVTAACLMTRKADFEAVGGFTEELTVAYNDVDYCLKLREQGKLIVLSAQTELYHYESLSRGYEEGTAKQIRFLKEQAYMHSRWAEYFVLGDPYMNKNLNQDEPVCWFYHL